MSFRLTSLLFVPNGYYSLIKGKLTWYKAPLRSCCYLPRIQSNVVHLKTGNPTTEIPSISNPHSHPDGIIRSQSYPSNTLPRNHSPTDEQLGRSGFVVIRRAHVLPAARLNSFAYQSGGEVTCSTFGKTHEERATSHHPEMYTPGARVVVKNRSCSTLVVHPCENGNRFFCVQFSEVRELDEAVSLPKEFVARSASSVRAWRWSDI